MNTCKYPVERICAFKIKRGVHTKKIHNGSSTSGNSLTFFFTLIELNKIRDFVLFFCVVFFF